MGLRKRIKKLSRLTQELLAEGESERADFKRSPDGISSEDLVAFANSEGGGTILAGIEEHVINNAQVGSVRGCDVGDPAILQILNKAVGCIPPVSIDVFTENLDDKPILRIVIVPSLTRPHCTPKGVYCRRDGARNRALHPSELLKLFLETEARSFASRFEVAADRISKELGDLESSLDRSIQNMSDQLGWADSQLGDTESSLNTIQAMVGRLIPEIGDISTRFRVLYRQDKRVDPIRERERLKFINRQLKYIMEDKNMLKHVLDGGDLRMDSKNDPYADITDEDAAELLKVAVMHVRNKEEQKKYSVSVKAPKQCTETELDQFADKVAAGGEVIDGARQRIESAFRLGFIFYDGVVVGTAAIKKPAATYRTKVFEKAKSKLVPTEFHYELGWIFLDLAHRKKAQMTRLLKELMPVAKENAIFATTRTTNDVMQEMLLQLEFSQDGNEYRSEQQADAMLKLFVLRPKVLNPEGA